MLTKTLLSTLSPLDSIRIRVLYRILTFLPKTLLIVSAKIKIKEKFDDPVRHQNVLKNNKS